MTNKEREKIEEIYAELFKDSYFIRKMNRDELMETYPRPTHTQPEQTNGASGKMIYRSDCQYLCDKTGDQGDSAMRIGMLAIPVDPEVKSLLLRDLRLDMICYEVWSHDSTPRGLLVRGPGQSPKWTNPYNVSRDQIKAFIAGACRIGLTDLCRRVFYSRLKHGFFAQNTERDLPGTTKYPWPHKVDGKWRLFDFADPLLPQDIGQLIIVGKIAWAYPFLVVAFCFHLLFLGLHAVTSPTEENQQIAECSVYGTLKLYRLICRNWKTVSAKYWGDRGELEYHNKLVDYIEGL